MKHWSFDIGEWVIINDKSSTGSKNDMGRLGSIKDLLTTITYDYRVCTNNGEINVKEYELNKIESNKLSRYLEIRDWKKVRLKGVSGCIYDVKSLNYLKEKAHLILEGNDNIVVNFNQLEKVEEDVLMSEEKVEYGVSTLSNKELHKSLLDEIHDTYVRKNTDYGNSFEEQFKEYGLLSAIIRFDDKIRRLKQLNQHEAQVKDESIFDTVTDLANYAIMAAMELRKGR